MMNSEWNRQHCQRDNLDFEANLSIDYLALTQIRCHFAPLRYDQEAYRSLPFRLTG